MNGTLTMKHVLCDSWIWTCNVGICASRQTKYSILLMLNWYTFASIACDTFMYEKPSLYVNGKMLVPFGQDLMPGCDLMPDLN